MKRVIAMLLLIAIVFSAACSKTDPTAQTTGTIPVDNHETSTGTQDAELIDRIERKEYNGYEFNYLALETGINGTTRFVDEMWVETQNGEVINDATWTRNLLLQDRLNIIVSATASTNPAGDLRAAVQAGDNSYDMAGAYKPDSLSLASEGMVRDWNKLNIDFSQEWWSQGAVEKLQVLNSQLLMSGSILISEIDDTLAMIYNKGIAEDYNLEDVYNLVLDGKWTIDKFTEMTSKVSNDLDGDSKMTQGIDLFGYVQDPASMTNNWFFSSDLLNGYVEADGAYNINIQADKVQTMLEKLAPLFASDNVLTNVDLYEGLKYFEENTIFMYAIILRNLELLREMDIDFGVIPYPMFDETQERYITHVGSASPILTIPLTNSENDERLADILEAMAIASHQYLIPAYYETALKEKIVRDPESATMLDIIIQSKTYDISYLIGNGLVSVGAPLLARGSTTFASSWAKMESRTEKTIQKTIDKLVEASVKS